MKLVANWTNHTSETDVFLVQTRTQNEIPNVFENAAAPSRHTTQYYFLYGTGAIYHNGWKASFGYRPDFIDPCMVYPRPEKAENYAGREVWELYDVENDLTEVHDLTQSIPAKLEERYHSQSTKERTS